MPDTEGPLLTAVKNIKAHFLATVHSLVAWVATQAARVVRVAKGLPAAIAKFFVLLWTHSFTVRDIFRFVGSLLLTVIIVGVLLGVTLVHFGNRKVPGFEPVSEIVYQDQGWGPGREAQDRQDYYYTPQGTSLKGLRYSWFAHL